MICDDGLVVNVDRSTLALQLSEGDVLEVDVTEEWERDWATARPAPRETRRRQEDAEARLERLRRKDPGGDIEL
jgi:hypothetical protein